MLTVTRKYYRKSDNSPPCVGYHLYYVTWGDLEYDPMTLAEYEEWRAGFIQETWIKKKKKS